MNNLIIYTHSEGAIYASATFKLNPDNVVSYLGSDYLAYDKPPYTHLSGGALHLYIATVQEFYTVKRDLMAQGNGTTWRNILAKLPL